MALLHQVWADSTMELIVQLIKNLFMFSTLKFQADIAYNEQPMQEEMDELLLGSQTEPVMVAIKYMLINITAVPVELSRHLVTFILKAAPNQWSGIYHFQVYGISQMAKQKPLPLEQKKHI